MHHKLKQTKFQQVICFLATFKKVLCEESNYDNNSLGLHFSVCDTIKNDWLILSSKIPETIPIVLSNKL